MTIILLCIYIGSVTSYYRKLYMAVSTAHVASTQAERADWHVIVQKLVAPGFKLNGWTLAAKDWQWQWPSTRWPKEWCQIPQAELTYCQRSKLIRYHWEGTPRSFPLVSKTLPNTTLNAWTCHCNQGAIGILRVWRSIFTTCPSCERWWN